MPAGGEASRFDLNQWSPPLRSVPGGQWARTFPFFTRRSKSTSWVGSPKNCTTEIGATGNCRSSSGPSIFGRIVPTGPGIALR